MELDKCRRDKNIFATYSQDEVQDLRAQLNICRGDLDHSRTREKKLRDDLAHCKQQPAAVVEPSIIHLESQIETQETTIHGPESNIKVLQTINTEAIADVRDAKRTAAAQFASARSLVEEIEAKFFAEQSECAEARQRGQDPGQDRFIHKSEATAITERVGEQLAEQRRIRKERHHKANSSEWERPGDTRSETQREFDQLPASRAGRGRGRGRTDQEHAQTRRASIQYMRQSADRQGEDTKADQERTQEPTKQIEQHRDWLVRVLRFFDIMESWVTWFVDNPPTDQEANDTVMEKCRQWIQLRTEIGADNLAKFLTTTESTASPNGYFSLASDSFQASISQGVSSGSVGLKSLADFSLSPFSFRGGCTRSAVNNSTASPLSRVDSQKERSHSQEVPVTPRSTGAQPHGNTIQ